MKKTIRSAQTEQKISSFLEDLNSKFSLTEFRPWNSRELVSKNGVTATITTVLSNLGAITANHGTVKLNERLYTLRASTVRKHINEYQASRKTPKAKKTKVRGYEVRINTPVQTESTFNEIVIALKAKIKQEVMSEILASLK